MDIKFKHSNINYYNLFNNDIIINGKSCKFEPVVTGSNFLKTYIVGPNCGSYYRITAMRQYPGAYYELSSLINYLELSDINMIEVGSYIGESCSIYLSTNKINKIYCIDILFNDNNIYHSIFNYFHKNNDKVVQFYGTLNNFINAQINPINNIDLIYIDSDHSYEVTKQELLLSINKVKPKYIAGHDYGKCFPGVIKAVDEVIGKPDKLFNNSYIKKINYQE